ncbi:MAG: metallophosphoesterase [Firmicutes bacterium]|nr:metallophosphoesterase [Bacillota bacterium]
MSLYAIGDLHLHFNSELKNRGQLKDRLWKNHEEKFRKNCQKNLTDEDTLVLVGDHSWGKNLEQAAADLAYIEALPGRKILTRGNHDMFWDANKTGKLNELYAGRLEFLQGNYVAYRDYALVGTKGFTFEGPFWIDRRGRIVRWDEEAEEHAKKIVKRELARLEESFQAAKAGGYKKFIVFLHYPPTSILEDESGFTEMAADYGAKQVIYAHCHGETRFYDSLHGQHRGITYRLVSGDFLRWMPEKILD